MDDVAREYLLIGLSLGEIEEGIVDSYFGPADVREEARAARAAPVELAARAASLRARLGDEVEAQRARWLDRQLIALETLARQAAGEEFPYRELVERCFDASPEATPPEEYSLARKELDELLPGSGDIRQRLDARDQALTIPAERLPRVLEWLAEQLRTSASEQFAVPHGEALTISLVTNEPWAAYNWYDGNLHSRIEVNTDLPVRATGLVGLLAHEAFPGHHLEHATKEQRLVRDEGRYEASVQLINTPESFISEGLADLGIRFVAPEQRWQELLMGIAERAGIEMSVEDAQRNWAISQALERLRGAGGDAALQLHAANKSREEVIAFLEHDALSTRERAEKSIEFISHPLWRAYVFCYAGGENLLSKWLATAGSLEGERQGFSRLLAEQLTPSGIAEEIAQTS